MAPGHRLSPITSTSKNVPLNAPPVSCWHFQALKDNFLVLQVLMLSMWEHKRMVIDNFSKTRIKGSMLQVNHIRLSYGPRLVLDAGGGTVMLPRTYGYLSQDVAHEDPLAGEGTVRDFIFNSTGLDVAINTYEELANEVGQATEGELPALLVRFERAQNELDRLGYYDADARAEQLISGLEVGGVTLERYVSTLSGGQKTKLAWCGCS